MGIEIAGEPVVMAILGSTPAYPSGGYRLLIDRRGPGFIHDEKFEVHLGNISDEGMALAMLAGLRAAGYTARLFATSTNTVETNPLGD